MITLRVADHLIGTLSLAVLARLLLPADFGLVNYAIVALGILELLSNFGVDVALIRNKTASRAHFDTAWTLEVSKGVVVCLALLALAQPAATYFDAPALEHVMYVFALYPLISGLENIGIVTFRKDLLFNRQFLFVLGARVIGTSVTIVLAWIFRSYWALVFGVLARSAARVLLSYAMHRYRPRLSFAELRGIFDFSKWVFVQQLIQGLNERIPALAIGRVSGAEALAFFNVGQEIAGLGTTALRAPIRQALFPGFAKLSDDLAKLARAFQDSLAILLLVSLPIPIGIGLMAAHIVRLFLGENWMAMVPVLQILSLYGAVSAFGTSSHLVYWAANRPRITAMLSALRLVLLAPLLIWLVRANGMTGAAWALTISAAVVVVADYTIVLRVINVRLRDLISKVWRVLVATLAMTFAVMFVLSRLAWSTDVAVLSEQLALCVAIGAAAYLTMLTLLWRASGMCDGPERQTLALVRGLLQRPAAAAM